MSHRAGLTLGKFMPLHKGHELLLETAMGHSDELRVLVGVSALDTIPYAVRARWLEALLGSLAEGTVKTFEVHPDPDPDPLVAKDGQGTVVSEEWWAQWLARNDGYLRATDCVYTSDRYGAEIARRARLAWYPVDPDRELFPISAAEIRTDPRAHYRFVSDVAKPDFGLTVAIVGAESTGKSTLTRDLARDFRTVYAPEWGRIIAEAKPVLDAADFDDIVAMQNAMIRKAQLNGSGLCFTDTEAITTALFAPIYLGGPHDGAEIASRAQRFDLYVVLAPTVPQVQDGTRVLDDAGRLAFHEGLLAKLTRLERNFVLVTEERFEDRRDRARAAVQVLLAARSWS